MRSRPVVPELHAEEWLTIVGRGTVAVIKAPNGWTRHTLAALRGNIVTIDGKRYLVHGVEYQAVPLNNQSIAGKPLGLAVTETDL